MNTGTTKTQICQYNEVADWCHAGDVIMKAVSDKIHAVAKSIAYNKNMLSDAERQDILALQMLMQSVAHFVYKDTEMWKKATCFVNRLTTLPIYGRADTAERTQLFLWDDVFPEMK